MADQRTTTPDIQQWKAPAKTSTIVRSERKGTESLNEITKQSFSSQAPTPDSYKFALHGLLALGSTSGTVEEGDAPPESEVYQDQAVSTLDFARKDTLETLQNKSHKRRLSRVRSIGTRQQKTQDFRTTGSCKPGSSLDFGIFGDCEDSTQTYEAPDSSETIAAGTPPVRAVPTETSLELLKFYRYHVAPWLDICDADQHFGVSLLIESTRVSSLRVSVMRLAAISSSTACIPKEMGVGRIAPGMGTDENVVADADMRTVVDVLSVLADVVPNLAAFWLGEARGENRTRRHILQKSLLEFDYSSLSTCAYWLLIRLGKRNSPTISGESALLTNVQS